MAAYKCVVDNFTFLNSPFWASTRTGVFVSPYFFLNLRRERGYLENVEHTLQRNRNEISDKKAARGNKPEMSCMLHAGEVCKNPTDYSVFDRAEMALSVVEALHSKTSPRTLLCSTGVWKNNRKKETPEN